MFISNIAKINNIIKPNNIKIGMYCIVWLNIVFPLTVVSNENYGIVVYTYYIFVYNERKLVDFYKVPFSKIEFIVLRVADIYPIM